MAGLDEIFYKEFRAMLQERKAITGNININHIALPDGFEMNHTVTKKKKVIIRGIQDDYYNKLNNTECILWTKPKLESRKFGSDGEFLYDKKGNVLKKEVTLPHSCAAVISNISIGVPLKFKTKEDFRYVDYIEKEVGGKKQYRFIYIIPKKYCYSLNQMALVLSFNKLKNFYWGIEVALQSGHIVYMYVAPHKVGGADTPYRVLMTGTDFGQFNQVIEELNAFWLKSGILFNREECELIDYVKGRSNAAYMELDSTLDEFVKYDPEKSLADSNDDIEETDF